jgi:HAD superfamily phosphoserine phosphatase-like hydrolase
MLIVSDLEGTLTTGETWRALRRYLDDVRVDPRAKWFYRARIPGYLLTKIGLMDVQAYRQRFVAEAPRLLRGYTPDDIQRAAEWIVEHEIWTQRRADVIEELANFAAQGAQVIVVTGTYQPIADVFAQRIGATALGTILEMKDGVATGNIMGQVNMGAYKVTRLQAHLAGRTPDMAYGDTTSDLEMLQMSAQPVAVYPSLDLFRIAQANAWRVLGAASA